MRSLQGVLRSPEESGSPQGVHKNPWGSVKCCFPATKPPIAKPTAVPPPSPKKKPLTITLPATGGGQPLRSVTDILRELKTPAKAKTDSSQDIAYTRFGGAEVTYSSSALQGEAAAFAAALESANLPSQPSPPRASGPDPVSAPAPLTSSDPPQLKTDSTPADPSHLHRILNLYHHLPHLDTQPSHC